MGLRAPLGYSGQTTKFLELYLYLLDNFCTGCHTNDEYNKNCGKCPIGALMGEAKEYVLTTYDGDLNPTEKEVLDEIRKELSTLTPHPLFNASIILDKTPIDKLRVLRRLAHNYDYLERTKYIPSGHRMEHENEVTRRVEIELAKERRLAVMHAI